MEEKPWNLKPSLVASRPCNTILRADIDIMNIPPNPELKPLDLSRGDPTRGGVLKPHPVIVEAFEKCLRSGKCNGYSPAFGSLAGRKAVADKFSTPDDVLTPEDVILTLGCSNALDIAINGIANPGDNVLIPAPSFVVFRAMGEVWGVECRIYNLLPNRNWEVDLKHLESQIDNSTKAIVVNNPSNPCGSVYTAAHIRDIIEVAERHHLPIIADEMHWQWVFSGHEFVSFSSQSKNVPIISCRGLGKCFLVPGWRFGWLQMHDRGKKLTKIREGFQSLTQRIIGPTSLVEHALPTILHSPEIPSSYFKECVNYIEINAEIAYGILTMAPGLKPIKPQGSLSMMVHVNTDIFYNVKDATDLTEKLIREQSVYLLPGNPCLSAPNFFRLLLTSSHDEVREACQRIVSFCNVEAACTRARNSSISRKHSRGINAP